MKPMDVFGPHWEHHFERIAADWRARVRAEDIVLIPGDISWAMQLEHALDDLRCIAALPGRKLILRGNHDYWWSSLTQLRASLPEGMYAVQNDAFDAGDVVFCGTRGWTIPPASGAASAQDEKLYRREAMRLEMSLQAAGEGPKLCFLHYPPLYQGYQCPEILAVLEKYHVETCCYGHLHGPAIRRRFEGERHNTMFSLISADYLEFVPKKICE